MWQFIISGYVPGTNIQITFELLLTFSLLVLSIVASIWLFHKTKTVENEIRSLSAKINRIREISL